MEGASNAGTTSSSIAETGLGMTGTMIRAVDNGEFWLCRQRTCFSGDHSMGVILALLKLRMRLFLDYC